MPLELRYVGLLALSAALEVGGDVYIKRWANGQGGAVVGITLYLVGAVLWMALLAFTKCDLSKAVIAFVCVNTIMAVVAGWVLFEEQVTMRTLASLVLCVGGVLLAGE